MGTNFYLRTPQPLSFEGRTPNVRHIGKSSSGWAFTLHVYPEEGIQDLQDWERLLQIPGSVILNEYGDSLHKDSLLATINRVGYTKPLKHYPTDRWCIGQRDTYDLVTGDFS